MKADERWVLVILMCLLIILTVLYVGTFTTAKIKVIQARNLTMQNQQLRIQQQQQEYLPRSQQWTVTMIMASSIQYTASSSILEQRMI